MFETVQFLHSETCPKTIFKWTILVSGFNLETKSSTVLILDQAGMKIITKKTEILCLSRNPSHYTLQVSSNKL